MLRDVLFNVFPANRCRALVAVAVVGLSLGRADAQSYTFSPFDLTVSDEMAFVDLYTVVNDPLPFMSFTTVTISADWSVVSGDPWSNQARAVLWKTDTFPPEVEYFTPGAAYTGAAGNGSSTTLTWIGYMEGGGFLADGGSGLYFGAHQTSPGTTAQWNNITVILSNLDLPPNHEVAVIGETVSFELFPGMVKWYKYTVDTAGWYTFDTQGTGLSETPRIALYNADGQRLARTAENFQLLELTLTPGDYFLAAASHFNTNFRPSDFDVTSNSTAFGTFVINSHAFPIPEPTSAATLGLAALALLRRAPRLRARHDHRRSDADAARLHATLTIRGPALSTPAGASRAAIFVCPAPWQPHHRRRQQ